MQEQQYEIERQAQLHQLAIAADERWRSKASFLDDPRDTAQIGPALRPRDEAGYGMGSAGENSGSGRSGVDSVVEGELEQEQPQRPAPASQAGQNTPGANPWKQFEQRKGTPGEAWQPEAWSPGSARAASRSK